MGVKNVSGRFPLRVGRVLCALVLGFGLVLTGIHSPQTAAAQGATSTTSRSFNLPAKGSVNIAVQVPAPGRFEVQAQWSGTAETLSLLLYGPGQTQSYARRDGKSPLPMTFDISSALLAKGKNWRLNVTNPGPGSAQGQVTIRLPSAMTQARQVPAPPQAQKAQASGTRTPGASATTARRAGASAMKATQTAPQAGQAQALSRLHRGPMVWSPVSQLQRPANEPSRPPSFRAGAAPPTPVKSLRFNANLIKVNKRQPLAFQAFEVMDPKTGQPIPPETMLPPLPNGQTMRAADYYNDLNILENEFNALGYTLDVRRDSAPSIKLQETVIPQARAGQTRAASQRLIQTHRKLPIVKPLQTVEARQGYLKQQSEDKARLARLKDMLRRDPPPLLTPSGAQQQPPLQGKEFHYEYATDIPPLGDQDLFAIYLSGKAELYGRKLEVDPVAGAHVGRIRGDIGLKASAEVGGYVFGNKFSIIRLDGNAKGPSPGGEMSAKVTLYVAGMAARDLINYPATRVPDMEIASLPSWVSEAVSWETGTGDALTYSVPIPLGPFVVTLSAGVRATVGFSGTLFLNPMGAGGTFGPYVKADVFASAGLNLLIVEAGVEAELKLIDESIKLEASLELDGDPNTMSIFIAYGLRLYDEFEALSGSLNLYVCIYVPAFDWPPWDKKCWYWEILSWEGIKASGDFFDPIQGTWNVIEGGSLAGPTGGSRETEGSAGVTWYPDRTSWKLPVHEGIQSSFAPSVVEFNGELHAFWLNGYVVQSISHDTAAMAKTPPGPFILPGTGAAALNLDPFLMTWRPPSAVVFRNRIYLFHLGMPAVSGRPPDQIISYRYMDASGKVLGAKMLTAASYERPAAVVYKGELYLFFLQSGGKGIYYKRFRPGILSGDQTTDIVEVETKLIPGKVEASGGPAACVFGDRLYVFHKGANNNNIYYRYLDPAGQWGPPTNEDMQVEGASTSHPPAVGVAGDTIVLVYRRTNSGIYYRRGALGTISPPPGGGGGGTGAYRQQQQKLSQSYTDIVWPSESLVKGLTLSDSGPTVCSTERIFFLFHSGKDDQKLLYRWFTGF